MGFLFSPNWAVKNKCIIYPKYLVGQLNKYCLYLNDFFLLLMWVQRREDLTIHKQMAIGHR